MYVALTEHRDRIRLGLTKAGLTCPLLSIGPSEAELGSSDDSPLSAFNVSLPSPAPPIVPLDADSDASRYLELILAELARAAAGRTDVPLDSLLDAVSPSGA